jgi:hypothetical protein
VSDSYQWECTRGRHLDTHHSNPYAEGYKPACRRRLVKASSSDELLDEARLIQMKPAISSLNVNAKEVFKRVTLLDDVLVLEASEKLIKVCFICGCHREVVNLNTEDDLSSFRESCECDERFIDAQTTKFEALLCFR